MAVSTAGVLASEPGRGVAPRQPHSVDGRFCLPSPYRRAILLAQARLLPEQNTAAREPLAMTSRRAILTGLLLGMLALVIACSGAPESERPTPGKAAIQQANAKPGASNATDEARYAAIIEEATKARDAAVATRDAVRTRNQEAKTRYEKELDSFREAKAKYDGDLAVYTQAAKEYKALKDLDFAKKLKTEAALNKWYDDIIREYPGTAAAQEARRRLSGNPPKTLPLPAKAPKPPVAPSEPREPQYEPESPIPEVPTIAELRAEDARRAEAAKGSGDDHDPPLAMYDMTNQGSGANQGKVYVHGYTTKNGTVVQPHYRNPPGAGASRGRR
jgi:hypothetical protein